MRACKAGGIGYSRSGRSFGALSGIERMKNSSMRLTACLALVTASVALILAGNRCLLFVGLACSVLSYFFSQRRVRNPGPYLALLICLIGLVWTSIDGLRDGDIFARKPVEAWWWAIFIVAWLWIAVDEFRRWRSNRNSTYAA
jgi:hypothetical protein